MTIESLAYEKKQDINLIHMDGHIDDSVRWIRWVGRYTLRVGEGEREGERGGERGRGVRTIPPAI